MRNAVPAAKLIFVLIFLLVWTGAAVGADPQKDETIATLKGFHRESSQQGRPEISAHSAAAAPGQGRHTGGAVARQSDSTGDSGAFCRLYLQIVLGKCPHDPEPHARLPRPGPLGAPQLFQHRG